MPRASTPQVASRSPDGDRYRVGIKAAGRQHHRHCVT
jgi:hypothetical protein